MQENRFVSTSSLKTMVNVIEDLRIVIMELQNRVEDQESKLELLKAELERQILVDDRLSKELRKYRQELDNIKAGDVKTDEIKAGSEKAAAKDTGNKGSGKIVDLNTPIMDGAGFSHITADYLRSLCKR